MDVKDPWAGIMVSRLNPHATNIFDKRSSLSGPETIDLDKGIYSVARVNTARGMVDCYHPGGYLMMKFEGWK